jgi:predicted ABC-type ATPase
LSKPKFILVAGPNGAGKSHFASSFLDHSLVYLNPDTIQRINQQTELSSGRGIVQMTIILLKSTQQSFALETTLSG